MKIPDRLPFFCESLFQYSRNLSREVKIGNVIMGGQQPLRLQSMTTTNTLDTEATAQQCISIFEAGGEIVRITTQGKREAANLENIKRIITSRGYNFPLVADIHFNPGAAAEAARHVEKVRINPGNFADGAKKIGSALFTDDSYYTGLDEIRSKFLVFLDICREHNTVLRIGANHGSLSDRIMARYGDTPMGMVESCMEYLRICMEENFQDVVLSIKSSNTRVMVQTVRLLSAVMKSEGMNFPLHLGVTEAGSGEDGRIKSAVGIGALLADGLGDTIRVSLTEDPEEEIPVARVLQEHFLQLEGHSAIAPVSMENFHPYEYVKRKTHEVLIFGGEHPVAVVVDMRGGWSGSSGMLPEAIIVDDPQLPVPEGWENCMRIVPANEDSSSDVTLADTSNYSLYNDERTRFLALSYAELNDKVVNYLKQNNNVVILLSTTHRNGLAEQRAFFLALASLGLTHPVIVHRGYQEQGDLLQIKASADTGMLFLDGFGDGLSLNAPGIDLEELAALHFGILQASRVRFSRTEYISCPGCGRTLFDLQATTALIRARTSHLKGLKIAVMGCIVNGIGEMADADYGYVGGSPGKVSLFRSRELVEKNIPENEAVDKLIQLIVDNDDWVEPI